ncbi:coiled-coil domain-containing protein 148-like [Lampris incognitus]|uniref:coiled-coil domain-containing protein 148-like n=1 Tax=Lampris incognitus TaxID=2546036 RepID=UPI0024B5FE5F|nr:coiled-coil domain-containing protein 148-like [Lampris incognitus]
MYNCSCAVMSGRDLRAFVTNFRSEDGEKLALQMKDGLWNSKYKPVEYEALQAIVEAKHQESELIGQRVQRTRFAAKATKTSSALRRHRQVWGREYPKLVNAEERAESELCDFLRMVKPSSTTDTGIFSLQDYGHFLEGEREAFRLATVEPVLQLRDDLRFRLAQVRHQPLTPHPSDLEQVLQQVQFVKEQQEDISEKLHAEYLALEMEIAALGLDVSLSWFWDMADREEVPGEVLDSECPYQELKDSLVQAFHSLSERYQTRMQSLKERLQGIDRFCGWGADDHLRFELTVGQYTQDIPDRRALYMDMLQRVFSQKNRQELTDHEYIWDLQHFTKAQLFALAQNWQRDREELLARALVTLEEARHTHQEELELHRNRQHQQDVCSRLRDKVQRWRAQQEEVARLEAAVAARRQQEEEERLMRMKQKEAAIRSQQEEKMRQFYLKQWRRRQVVERRDQERLAQLRSVMEEQARRDKARVMFREEMLLRRREEREGRQLERQREEEERRNRLEALRNQVAVGAEADPHRLMGDTEAWRNRQRLTQEELPVCKPLYSINTYTDRQIVSDPRVRVEQALREAGLHHSHYAQEVLSGIRPTKPPRRDTESAVCKP